MSEEVRSARLDRLAVLHHGLDTKRADRTGKSFAFRFLAGEDGQCEVLAGEFLVNTEHFFRLVHRFFLRLVRRVALLPEEFRGAEKKTRTHFPTDDIGPLVDEERQIPIRLDPAGVGGTDDGLGGRTDNERLVQFPGRHQFTVLLLEPVMGDDRTFLGESLDMLRFFFEKAERDEERKVSVHMPGRLEHDIKLTLHVFPDPPAPRLDDHAAAHIGIFRQVGGFDDLLIPLGKIVGAGRGDGGLHGKLRDER